MKTKSFFAVLALLTMGIIISSCNKKEQTPNTSFAEDNAFAEDIFSDISSMADEAFQNNSAAYKSENGSAIFYNECMDVVLDLSSDPYLLSIDFGDTDCLCNDGHYRRGLIRVEFNGAYNEAGTVITHHLDEYFVDGNKVEGTQIVTNVGYNDENFLQFDVEAEAVIYRANDEGTITWNSTRVRKWIEGNGTWNFTDDIYLISGSANGTSIQNLNGSTTATVQTWQMNIVDDLRLELDCKWLTKGNIEIDLQGLPTALLVYGDGNCDQIATLEFNDNVYTIYMK